MNEAAIEVTGLRTRYGDREVLKGLTFAIPKGKTTVILGGSGCGKSTLLKHLIGLLKPSEGSISISGRELYRVEEQKNVQIDTRDSAGVAKGLSSALSESVREVLAGLASKI